VGARALHHTAESCNEYARTGYDVEFNRGGNNYDNFYGDLAVKPTLTSGRVGRRRSTHSGWIYPGNASTTWGLVTNKDAQVMDRNGEPIPGLYAVSCDQNSVFRVCYPGGGSSIGPGVTFGFRAGEHLARLWMLSTIGNWAIPKEL